MRNLKVTLACLATAIVALVLAYAAIALFDQIDAQPPAPEGRSAPIDAQPLKASFIWPEYRGQLLRDAKPATQAGMVGK